MGREHCSVWSTLPDWSSHFPPFPIFTLRLHRVVSVWLAGVWGLQLTFSFPFALQHGTEWTSAPCTVCSCTHGEVRCSHQPCSPISCGPQELEFLAEGACCPICVGAGSEYQLVGRGLSIFEVTDDILTLVFLVRCGSEILNSLPLWAKVVRPWIWLWVMPHRMELAQIFRLHCNCGILLVSYLHIVNRASAFIPGPPRPD